MNVGTVTPNISNMSNDSNTHEMHELKKQPNTFRQHTQVAHTLRQVGILETLTLLQVHQLCDALTEEVYEPGQRIITQGEVLSLIHI